MEKITYSDNWNGKLLCDCWPDIRKPIAAKYSPGTILEIEHNTIGFLGYAKVISVYPFQYKSINDHMSYTVTGKGAGFLKKILTSFYDNINNETQLVHVVLQWTQRNPDTLHQLMEKQYSKMLSITPRATQYADGPHQK